MGKRPPLDPESLRDLIEQSGELPPVDGLAPAELAVILADLAETTSETLAPQTARGECRRSGGELDADRA
jgi:hypothetical protein